MSRIWRVRERKEDLEENEKRGRDNLTVVFQKNFPYYCILLCPEVVFLFFFLIFFLVLWNKAFLYMAFTWNYFGFINSIHLIRKYKFHVIAPFLVSKLIRWPFLQINSFAYIAYNNYERAFWN